MAAERKERNSGGLGEMKIRRYADVTRVIGDSDTAFEEQKHALYVCLH